MPARDLDDAASATPLPSSALRSPFRAFSLIVFPLPRQNKGLVAKITTYVANSEFTYTVRGADPKDKSGGNEYVVNIAV